jgi:hypothetical protein
MQGKELRKKIQVFGWASAFLGKKIHQKAKPNRAVV